MEKFPSLAAFEKHKINNLALISGGAGTDVCWCKKRTSDCTRRGDGAPDDVADACKFEDEVLLDF